MILLKIKKVITSSLLLTSLFISAATAYATPATSVKSQDAIRIQGDQMEMTVVRYYTQEESRSIPYTIQYAENGWYGTLTATNWKQQSDLRVRVEYTGTVYLGQ
ncbi:hypothetical protein CXF51_11985 [Bacillus subtilis subsp. subtilis]|nr:hypothetical protein CXF51_11985 [Bacillus subtilis subsp. subtilis]